MSGEFELIDNLSRWFSTPSDVEVGIGDDTAVLAPERFDLVAMDTLVEEVHFRRDWSSPSDVGWKLAAANLSDVAAMGGRPAAFFLSLALPKPLGSEWVEGFCAGINRAVEAMVLRPEAVSAAGGDLSATRGPAVVTMTLLGEAEPAAPILRSGASLGDLIVVSSVPGRSAAGLAVLASDTVSAEEFPELVAAHLRPRAEVETGRRLGRKGGPSAMIDVSDGLIQDLGHLLEASEAGARVDLSSIELSSELRAAAEKGLGRTREWVGAGGEDFSLLMTIPGPKWEQTRGILESAGDQWHRIGEVVPATEGLKVVGPDGTPIDEPLTGFRHFEES